MMTVHSVTQLGTSFQSFSATSSIPLILSLCAKSVPGYYKITIATLFPQICFDRQLKFGSHHFVRNLKKLRRK